MPLREADRRGRAARGGIGLLERDDALATIADVLDDARSGNGRALLISGHPGMGKTRLHEAALDEARRRDLLAIRGTGSELEQNLAFGVAGQLLRSLSSEIPSTRRAELLAEAPSHVRTLDGPGEAEAQPDAGEDLAVSHGLFTLLATATESTGAVVAIDDLHWTDTASLRFVLYLLHRLDELPVTLVLTSRIVADDDPAQTLDRISVHPRLEITELTPLGPDAVCELVGERLGDRADSGLGEVCAEVTGGNPFYLRELLLALAEETQLDTGQLVRLARTLAPDTVTRSLRVRVGRLGPDATALAAAVAILGDDVPVRHAAALSGVEIPAASTAADALAKVQVLLAREPLRFVHPLVRQAVSQDIAASVRGSRHLDAARLLYAEGFGAEHVAAHLLRGRAEGDKWVVERLRAAAREARSRGAAESAVRYLERALAEPPSAAVRGEVLTELGTAEAVLGLPVAVEHLTTAAAVTGEPRRRAELALAKGQLLYRQGQHEHAAAAFEEGLAALAAGPADDDVSELHDHLQTGFITTAALVPSLRARSIDRSARLLADPPEGPLTQGQRLLLAQAAAQAAFAGQPAAAVLELAERAWDSGTLLKQEGSDGLGWTLLTTAFPLAGDLERALEVTDAALDDARRRDSPLAFATASYIRGLPELWQGRVTDAIADLELARDARRFGWRQFVRAAAAHYALCLVEGGELDRADAALAEDTRLTDPYDLEDAIGLYALARLRRSQRRFEEALEAALAAGRLAEQTVSSFGYAPWRGEAAQSLLALGDRDRARGLAAEALERAERTSVLHERLDAHRVAGLCEGEARGIELLRTAVELGASAPPRLETIRALVDLGAALRRANQRSDARLPLQQAVDLARQGGAFALHEQARIELAATGARPRREALLSGPASLTPSERRIAELAATGRSNREIAQTLFVTPKTVEYHLRNSYRKLDVAGRGELADALADRRPPAR
jgi:DNA-binding CsgD family transcriptional regulator